MSGFQRVRKVLFGLCMIAVALFFIFFPSDEAYMIIVAILSLGLAIVGIKDIIFYFTMAKHMIGGKMILIQGVIILDFALITGSLANVPKIYILLYLIGIHAFSGVVEILRAMESKKAVEGPWKLKFTHGIINFLLAIACLIFIRKSHTALLIYSLGLIYSAVVRIFSAFRRTSFILIN
ncbi:DUF308 domain-containing protein [Butyrivibrio sp. AE2032]|uniref:DUF308 domain-containing protein n=1 Tax=Butyrivibrio sp. AE2032 TaxID=1458463 RepID=UPI00054EEEA8|nr:DUF308 domain-containing protein [Butyrivibrio sp. AE2032]